jgi:outer membrane lipoprotein carrier protein
MKTPFLITLFLAINFVGFAQQTGDTQEMKDPQAKAILDKLSEKNKTYTSIKANFEYILTNKAEGINETQKGNLALKGNKYKLNISGQQIISNGKTVWTYIEDADEVQISSVAENDDDNLFNPATIFTIYEKGFKYKFNGEETVDGVLVQNIMLYPEKAKEKSYHTIQLVVDKNKVQINSIIIKSKDGNTYTYKLSKFESNTPMADADFNFDVSKVSEVIDLRD